MRSKHLLSGTLLLAGLISLASLDNSHSRAKAKVMKDEKKESKEVTFQKGDADASSKLVRSTLDVIDEIRPALYRYCHSLTGCAFSAEDLVQETLAKALHRLSMRHSGVENPKSYLFRIATNAWIDELRRHRPSLLENLAELEASKEESKPVEVSEAFVRLVATLGPRERVVIVLREAFDFPMAEIATFIGTSEGNVRVLLHRARKALESADPQPVTQDRPSPPEPLVDAFVKAFNKRDAEAIVKLLAPTGESDIIGVYNGLGDEVAENILEHTFPDKTLLEAEKRVYRGETIVLIWYHHPEDKEKRVIRDILRLEGSEKELTRIVFYYFAKDLLHLVAKELGIEAYDNDYHFPIKDD